MNMQHYVGDSITKNANTCIRTLIHTSIYMCMHTYTTNASCHSDTNSLLIFAFAFDAHCHTFVKYMCNTATKLYSQHIYLCKYVSMCASTSVPQTGKAQNPTTSSCHFQCNNYCESIALPFVHSHFILAPHPHPTATPPPFSSLISINILNPNASSRPLHISLLSSVPQFPIANNPNKWQHFSANIIRLHVVTLLCSALPCFALLWFRQAPRFSGCVHFVHSFASAPNYNFKQFFF